MTYELWHNIFLVSAAAAAFFTALTVFFLIRFRFIELVRFWIMNRRAPDSVTDRNSRIYTTADKGHTSVTEQFTDQTVPAFQKYSDGTVIAGSSSYGNNDFIITRNTVITGADASVIDM